MDKYTNLLYTVLSSWLPPCPLLPPIYSSLKIGLGEDLELLRQGETVNHLTAHFLIANTLLL